MVSVEEVSARLECFIRQQTIAHASVAPDREHQVVVNMELRNKLVALEAGPQDIVERRMELTE